MTEERTRQRKTPAPLAGFSTFSGLTGVLLGAAIAGTATIVAQIVAHWLAHRRQMYRFRVQTFERFRREFSEDENLRRISNKKEPLTEEEIDDYLGFFEEIGLYFHRKLVDMELVDELLGDYIIDAWEDQELRESVGKIRLGEKDSTYFVHFERLAEHLIRMKTRRVSRGR